MLHRSKDDEAKALFVTRRAMDILKRGKVVLPKEARVKLYFSVLRSQSDLAWLCALDDKSLVKRLGEIVKEV